MIAGTISGFVSRKPPRLRAAEMRASSAPLLSFNVANSLFESSVICDLSAPSLSHLAASGSTAPLSSPPINLPSAAESSGVIAGASLTCLKRPSRISRLSASTPAGLFTRATTSLPAEAASMFCVSALTSGFSDAGSALSSAAVMATAGLREAAATAPLRWKSSSSFGHALTTAWAPKSLKSSEASARSAAIRT
ncbi:proteophosphoglycan ppg4 [Chthoniobacter flavus Ellin428]|uniref:Proteophosphoglycan ppg4 n=1 Tax=Chthoniobacter flavus Ellin428 TaxID=497964 RepID=B4D229_9BACT|nr:proteophosphoglycan ppg4 [Chthoniobacter flavus Ellin428]